MDEFKNRLRLCRNQLDLKQQDIAEELNIVYRTYRRYETGETKPDIETAAKLAQYFHVSLDYLAGLTDDPTPPNHSQKENPIP